MGKYLFIIVLVVGTVLCQFVESQPQQQRSINGQRNKVNTGRSISTNGNGNQVSAGGHNSDESEDEAFDNSPNDERDSSEIVFPADELHPPVKELPSQRQVVLPKNSISPDAKEGHWKKIPLSALVKFGTEQNLASFFKNYVNNTKVVQDNVTKEEFLTDAAGNPILTVKSEKMVVTKAPETFIPPGPSLRYGSITPIKGRSGSSPPPEARAQSSVSKAVNGAPFQTNSVQSKPSLTLPVCTPESTTVSVPLTVEPHLLIIPKCVKVERCGGCCFSDITVCEPESTEMVEFSITTLGYIGDGNGGSPLLEFVNVTSVEIERHKSCKCKCRTKKEHCKSRHHQYVEGQCSCICTNTQAYQQCLQNPNNRVWDSDTCMCGCRETKVCSSGYFFDLNTCDCQQEIESRLRKMSGIPAVQSAVKLIFPRKS